MEIHEAVKRLSNIFDKYQEIEDTRKIALRGYSICEFESKPLLFIGANPSLQECESGNRGHFNLKAAIQDYGVYFKSYEDLANSIEMHNEFCYLDFLNLRESKQAIIENYMRKSQTWVEFITEQLQLTQQIIEHLGPKLIVVCNAGFGKFLGIDKIQNMSKTDNVWMGYDFHFDSVFGVNVISGIHQDSIMDGVKRTNLIGTPVIFSGFLKYLSAATKKTLEWQIKNVMHNHAYYFGYKYNKQNETNLQEIIRAGITAL